MKNPENNSLKSHILVVEDEEDIVRLITFHLEKEGYRVTGTGNGREALELAHANPPDLVVLDIMLPEMDGLEVCRRLRSSKETANVPILVLSAKKEELDKVLGLELGADDYMVKPFSVRELVARVRAIFRRFDREDNAETEEAKKNGMEERILSLSDIILYHERHQVMVNGEQRILTHKEFLLLELLMENVGKVLTRDLLLDKIWGYEVGVDTRTVDVHIRYLRQKIETDPASPRYIETVRGVGYKFVKD